MIWLGLLLVFDATAADCGLRTTTRDLAQSISDVEAAFVSMDINAFNEAEERTHTNVECLKEALTPYDSAGFHRMSALRAFIVRDEDSAKYAYVAALTAQPNYNLPESLAPPGKSLDLLYKDARLLAEEKADRIAVDIPTGAIMLVDGRRDQMRPVGRPALVQLLDLKGTVLWSGYLPRNGMDPDFTGIEVEIPADQSLSKGMTESSSESKRPLEFRISGSKPSRQPGFEGANKTLVLASAASVVTAVILYGSAAAVAAKHADDKTDFEKLESLKSLNHGLIIASGLAGGIGIGLGTVIYFN